MAVSAGHIGLAAIGERIRSQGGRLEIGAGPDGGTTIRVTIPLEITVRSPRGHEAGTL
jgi:signal transduction histidine kinase